MKKLFGSVLKKIRKRSKAIGIKKLICVFILILMISGAYTAYKYIYNEYISHITLTLNYANGKNGLTPTGARFNITDIKSDEVIQGALDRLGDDSLSVDFLKSRIRIDTKMPHSAIDEVKTAIAENSTYAYCPSEFMIYYSQKNKLAKNNVNAFLRALSESYSEFFAEKYASNNKVLEFDINEELDKYDYNEKYNVIYDKLAAMLSYLNQRQIENDSFRSNATGYSFGNLISLLGNVRDVDLAKLNAYIIQNGVSKDKKLFINKQQYNIDKKMLQFNVLNQGSEISKDAMKEYDYHLTGVTFIPTVDRKNEFYMSRTKTGLDNLVTQSFDSGVNAVEKKKVIENLEYMIKQFNQSSETTRPQIETAEQMVNTVCHNLEKISNIAIQTDNEYIDEKFDNYITFYYTKINYKIYIIMFMKVFVALSVLALASMLLFKELKKYVDRKLSDVSKLLIKKAER